MNAVNNHPSALKNNNKSNIERICVKTCRICSPPECMDNKTWPVPSSSSNKRGGQLCVVKLGLIMLDMLCLYSFRFHCFISGACKLFFAQHVGNLFLLLAFVTVWNSADWLNSHQQYSILHYCFLHYCQRSINALHVSAFSPF